MVCCLFSFFELILLSSHTCKHAKVPVHESLHSRTALKLKEHLLNVIQKKNGEKDRKEISFANPGQEDILKAAVDLGITSKLDDTKQQRLASKPLSEGQQGLQAHAAQCSSCCWHNSVPSFSFMGINWSDICMQWKEQTMSVIQVVLSFDINCDLENTHHCCCQRMDHALPQVSPRSQSSNHQSLASGVTLLPSSSAPTKTRMSSTNLQNCQRTQL